VKVKREQTYESLGRVKKTPEEISAVRRQVAHMRWHKEPSTQE